MWNSLGVRSLSPFLISPGTMILLFSTGCSENWNASWESEDATRACSPHPINTGELNFWRHVLKPLQHPRDSADSVCVCERGPLYTGSSFEVGLVGSLPSFNNSCFLHVYSEYFSNNHNPFFAGYLEGCRYNIGAEWVNVYKSLWERDGRIRYKEEWPHFQTLPLLMFDGSVIILSSVIF